MGVSLILISLVRLGYAGLSLKFHENLRNCAQKRNAISSTHIYGACVHFYHKWLFQRHFLRHIFHIVVLLTDNIMQLIHLPK